MILSLRPPTIAAIIAALAGLWIASGLISDAGGGLPRPDLSQIASPPRVQVKTQQAEPFRRSIIVTGRTEASRRVELRNRLKARVSKIHAEKGVILSKGDPILTLDIEDRAAQVAKSEALLDQRKLEYEAARKLADKGYRAETKLAEARANYELAKANLARRKADLSFTVIKAPFDGVLDSREAELGDYLRDGDRIGFMIDLDPILIVAEVSETEVAALRVGMPAEAELVTGERLEGVVHYISSIGNPATRTFRIELEATNANHKTAEGITAGLRIPSDSIAAHHISPAILTLNDLGDIGVKTVNGDNTVEFHPVRIVGSDNGGMWLAGLPEMVRLITVGQEFVMDGQTVAPVEEGAASPTAEG